MQSIPSRRHRATRRPARKNLSAASAGLALSMVASGVGVASAAPTDAAPTGVDVSALAQQAKDAALNNAPLTVATGTAWTAPSLDVKVEVRDSRAERRAKAEEEAKKRAEEERKAREERAARAERAASRDAFRTSQNADTAPAKEAPAKAAPAQEEQAEAPAGNGTGGVVGIAYRYLGTPYRWGGTSPSGFDCSGFTSYVYRQVGINLPHSSGAQPGHGRRVSASQARPGDLVWRPGHVGIYIGGGKMIHAPRPGKSVEIIPVRGMSYYRMR
ncbi:hypothetical protein BSR29_04990 [Boudabousia liubingyangii]|uniref:NlpC/P60 domain-containing protein n=1 Tax=Boudabousia liubingyangii TaxID=1921764 RepID=A0A1Q5PLD3_9ACTO|nr:C40 family peptidase [Boudabousia liubingyangii]OKL47087.1 hypothetical protein BSR28_06690 [Boudabousia liubingyangii]OKL47850.1 hypothetical protein BSR29_04990 [Boudabousia liubingyangii]